LTHSTDSVPNLASPEVFPDSTVIQIEMWDAHATDRYGTRSRFMIKHSIDGAPLHPENRENKRVAFRFSAGAWFGEIKTFLVRNGIPVTVQFVRSKTDLPGKHRSASGKYASRFDRHRTFITEQL
jgi:hypothetical protein